MKKAKVNPVYEGRGRDRSKGNSSKSERMIAKGRRNGVRTMKALSIVPDNWSMVTRSMATQTMELEGEGTLYKVEISQAPVEEMNDDNKTTEQVQQPVNEVVPVENKGDDEEMLFLDDLPMICNYEEGWPCFSVGYGWDWYTYCEPTNGFWEPFGDVNFEPVWDDALWDFKNDDKTKKL